MPWRRSPSTPSGDTCHPTGAAGLFLFMCVVQGGIILYKNGLFRSGRAQAHITHVYGAVRLRIQCRKPLDVRAGQHINLWMPAVSFWAFPQSHPFVVISWAETPQDYIDLFVEPRRGLTRELFDHAKNGRAMHSLVLFSGPHGKSVPMDDCETQLPYLKQLIRGYNARKLRARRIHLVWQVRDIDVTIAAQPLLNDALNEDTLDDGWILAISIYSESNDTPSKSFGKRANVYSGKAPLRDIFQAELTAKLTAEQTGKKPVKDVNWDTETPVEGRELESGRPKRRDGKMLVTVSATDDIRDELRSVVREHLTDEVSFFELDYQPS
ncbi:hypothetical protein DL95DRAFT_526617 [Leptodontidium sp. 2 PMI_412]|nr:hypothetical protein DL95DRAFT_526617 [Leptodontidium sp. 2 PMI_412]